MFPCVVWQLAVPEMIFIYNCTIRPGLPGIIKLGWVVEGFLG